jgi:hypothetical protein
MAQWLLSQQIQLASRVIKYGCHFGPTLLIMFHMLVKRVVLSAICSDENRHEIRRADRIAGEGQPILGELLFWE